MLHLVFLLSICLVNLQPSCCQEDRRNAIISAIENAIRFLAEDHDNVNVDAVVGFAILEGYLNKVLETLEGRTELTVERQRITMVMRQTLLTSMEKAAQNIERQDPASYKGFAPALKPGFWKPPQDWKKIQESGPYSLTSGNCLDLKTSDYCISVLLERQDDSNVCEIADNCTSLMTNTHCAGYSLSHQLFFFLFAREKSCSNSLFQNAGYYENMLCDLMMQANHDFEKKNLLHTFADLFTENIMFCGLAGFSDFYQASWLDHILSWQKKDKGCFWMYPSANDGGHVRRLSKRSEKIIKGTCSSHNTAVAVGALGGFLLYGL